MAGLEEVKTRLGPGDAALVRAIAEARGVSVAEIVRQAIQEHLARREGVRVQPLLDAVFAEHADRLAELLAKTHIAAATAAWEVQWLVAQAHPTDSPRKIMRQCVARAGVDLRRPGAAVGEAARPVYEAADRVADETE